MDTRYKIIIFMIFVFLTACQTLDLEKKQKSQDLKQDISQDQNADNLADVAAEKFFELKTSYETWDFGMTSDTVWTYNGTVPGETLKVQEGDWIEVRLINGIKEPVTIHWHGMVLPNKMDGVSGVTQDPVKSGESFTYKFQANDAGTYWYHSHHQSSEQVDKGLYGPLIVEPEEKSYDRDFVIILDEWLLSREHERNSETRNMMGYMMGMGRNGQASDTGDMDTQMLYNSFTVNGKIAPYIEPIQANTDERIRLRFINAGNQKHTLYFSGHPYEIVALDAQKVYQPEKTTKNLEIAPGERIDVEIDISTDHDFEITSVDNDFAKSDLIIPVHIAEKDIISVNDVHEDQLIWQPENEWVSDHLLFSDPVEEDLFYELNLNTRMKMGRGMQFTINDEVFPKTPTIDVQKGEVIRVRLVNQSMLDHPMHLHGHHFQIVKKNGQKLDQPFVKDLINVKPYESYEIVFKANNPGEWLFHCHDLLHADNGMISIVSYIK